MKVASGSDSAGTTSQASGASDRERLEGKKDALQTAKKKASGKGLQAAEFPAQQNSQTSKEEDETTSDKQFARQMAGLKTGSRLAPPSEDSRHRTTVTQSGTNNGKHLSATAAGINGSGLQNLSATSSTTGMDADDDLSPTVSPALAATSAETYVSSGDISDMLEAPQAGPSVLKIIPSSRSAPTPRSSQQKPSQPTETKKQRQNRKKAEEQKAARMEAEIERRALLEKQLRTARQAEGRPAKNGTAASSATQVPSVWKNSPKPAESNGNEHTRVVPESISLLDTFDRDNLSNRQAHDHQETGRHGAPAKLNGSQGTKAWNGDLPSEEEQLRMLNQLDENSGWSTVPKGRKPKRNKTGADGRITGLDSSESEGRIENLPDSQKPSNAIAGSVQGTDGMSGPHKYIGRLGVEDAGLNGGVAYKNPGDSDWAVL